MSAMRAIWRVLVPASFLLVVGSMAVWVTDAAPPIEFQSIDVRAAAVPRGGALKVEYLIIRHRSCPGVLQRVIIDSQEVIQLVEPQRLLVTSASSEDPELTRVVVSIPVPAGAAPGMARYQAVMQYQCNPLHRLLGASIDVRTPIIEFEVLRDVTEPQRSLPGPQHGGDVLPPAHRLRRISLP